MDPNLLDKLFLRIIWCKKKAGEHALIRIVQVCWVLQVRNENQTRMLQILIVNPLPDDKIIDWSKLKQNADKYFKCI